MEEVLVRFKRWKVCTEMNLWICFNKSFFRSNSKWMLNPLSSCPAHNIEKCPVNFHRKWIFILDCQYPWIAYPSRICKLKINKILTYFDIFVFCSHINEHFLVKHNLCRIINWYLLIHFKFSSYWKILIWIFISQFLII